jgi:LysM repeat protein
MLSLRVGRRSPCRFYVFVAALLGAALACARADEPVNYANVTPIGYVTPFGGGGLTPLYEALPGDATATLVPPTVVAGLPIATPRPTQNIAHTPTPDHTRASVLSRQTTEEYTVQRGDTLNSIGEQYGVTAAEIAAANGITISDTLFAGQVLIIPVPTNKPYGPDLKIVPDSEFVYGPGTIDFNLHAFVESQHGYLATYAEEVPGYFLDGQVETATVSGSDIVRLMAQRYSINPRLLLALLEYQSGWVTQAKPSDNSLVYPLRRVEAGRDGLFRQLSWAADELNFGYYAWRVGGLVSWNFRDSSLRLIAPGLNAGTVGVQNFFAQVFGVEAWTKAVSADGFPAAYRALFGNPFALAYEPLTPADLTQPVLQLPFEPGKVWAFTGGPHGAWDSGSAWGALDFAPPAETEGCTLSDEWVAAAAPGLIVRSEYGAVLEDLDGDGYEGTGWVLFYMHVESRDRIAVGTFVLAGDRLGHPSCEGGVSSGTHLHFARKYNGEWIPADGALPFILDGWVSSGFGKEYDGALTQGEWYVEAYDGRGEINEISRP